MIKVTLVFNFLIMLQIAKETNPTKMPKNYYYFFFNVFIDS